MSPSRTHEIGSLSLDDVVRQMPTAVVIVEAPSGRIVHANARARDMTERQLGRPIPPELTPDFEIFHPDGRPYEVEEWPLVRSLTAGEEVVDEEYFNVLADGSHLTVVCSSSPIYDEPGRIVAGVLLMNDVTAQRHVQERLAYHASLVENMEDAVIATDERFVVTAWNRGAERLYGRPAAEVLGRHVRDVIRSEMSETERDARFREIAEAGRSRIEVRSYRKDGTPVDVEVVNVAIRGERGEITGYLGIHRDVSERKRAEEALREAGRRTERVLEGIPDAFFALDRQWQYTYVNEPALDRARTAKGAQLTRDDVLGKNCWALFPEAVGTAVDQGLHTALREQRSVTFETHHPATSSWVEVHAYPFEDGVAGFSSDVTDRREAQEELERRVVQQALVAELSRRALSSDDLEAVLDDAVGLVAATLETELAGVAEMAPSGDEMIFRSGVGWRDGVVGQRVEREGPDSLLGYTLRRGRPVIVEDASTDPHFKASAISSSHGVVSSLSVMIESPGEPFGALAALSTRRRSFSESDVSFVQAVADVLASAVERSRAQQRLDEVREAERSRIARDLHDEALQELTDAVVQAGRGRSAGLQPEAADRLVATLKRASQQLRGVIYDLRLEEEESRAFSEALEEVVSVQRAMAVGCELSVDIREGALTGPLGRRGIEVLRIVGEALTNGRRHSGARHIRVSAGRSGDRVYVEVSDDGRGFDATQLSRTDGTGIKGMRERATLLDGDLVIDSAPGVGTSVRFDAALRS